MIEIKITGATPLEAMSSLTAFGLHCMKDETVAAAARRILEQKTPSETQKGTAQTPEASTTPNPQSSADLPPEPYVEDPPHETPEWNDAVVTEPPTPEEVRAAGIKASRTYGTPAVKAILDKFGAKGMSGLKEGDRAAFLAELGKLGAGTAEKGDPNA